MCQCILYAFLFLCLGARSCLCSNFSCFAVTRSQFDCDFENDLCNWTQDKQTDDFEWLRASGPTSSDGTGPTVDHTTNKGKKD